MKLLRIWGNGNGKEFIYPSISHQAKLSLFLELFTKPKGRSYLNK